MSMMKAQTAKVPAKAGQKAVAVVKAPAKVPAVLAQKAAPKPPAKPQAKAKAKPAAKAQAKAPARKKSGQEAMLARVEAVRLAQRQEGHFDCFGRASEGFCDQGGCSFHTECLSVSRMLHAL